MPITGLTLAVVGADFPNRRGPSRRFEIALCRAGEAVMLVPEPNNPVDPRAIKVMSERDVQLGYIAAERCGWICQKIAAGIEVKAVFQEPTGFGALIRASLDENDPDLPPEREATNRPPEFYPDDIYPDE